MNQTPSNTTKLTFVLWLLISFFCLDFFYRISSSLIIEELQTQLSINNLQMGLIASAFYIGYVLMQLPAGMLLDYFSPRKIIPGSVIICTLSFLAFIYSQNFYFAYAMRLLLGATSSFAFIIVIAFAMHNFSKKQFLLICSTTIAIGTLSSSIAEVIITLLSTHFHWQRTYSFLSLIGLIIGGLLFANRNTLSVAKVISAPYKESVLQTTKYFFTNRKLLINGVIGGLLYLPTSLLASLWGIPFITNHLHLSKTVASLGITFLFLGWAIGSALYSAIAFRRFSLNGIIAFGSIFACIMCYLFVNLYFTTQITVYLSLMIIGIFSSCQVLTWEIFKENYKSENYGIGTACNNMLILILPIIFHVIVGHLNADEFQGGLKLLPGIFIFTTLIAMQLRRYDFQEKTADLQCTIKS